MNHGKRPKATHPLHLEVCCFLTGGDKEVSVHQFKRWVSSLNFLVGFRGEFEDQMSRRTGSGQKAPAESSRVAYGGPPTDDLYLCPSLCGAFTALGDREPPLESSIFPVTPDCSS